MFRIDTVAVLGLGYIGLPTAAILASKGVRVHGVDVSTDRVDAVNRGEVPFTEPDLAMHVAGAVAMGTLTAHVSPPEADCFIIAVPTPFLDGHEPDLSYIRAASEAIAPRLRGGELIILESTSPPRTTERVAEWILAARPDLSLDGEAGRPTLQFAHCPERVLPGRIMVELVTNDRIVGGLTIEAADRARSLYELFCRGDILTTDSTTAEMVKLVENSFRDVNIAFANELSLIADTLGVDVWKIIELANHHPRVNVLQPGPGVGGHCIAVDPWFIVDADPENARLIRTAREVNDSKPRFVLRRLEQAIDGLEAPTVAMLGLAFKPDVDDLRESPALQIVTTFAVQRPDATVLAVEPNIDALPATLEHVGNVHLTDAMEAIELADVVVILVAHSSFRRLRPGLVRSGRIIDTIGIW